MLKIRRVRVPARFSRRLTQWGLTLLVVVVLLFSVSAAYKLMVGEYSASPAARRAAHPTLVNGRQAPIPARADAG